MYKSYSTVRCRTIETHFLSDLSHSGQSTAEANTLIHVQLNQKRQVVNFLMPPPCQEFGCSTAATLLGRTLVQSQ